MPNNQNILFERPDYLQAWEEAIVEIAHHYRLDVSQQNIHITAQHHHNSADDALIRLMAKRAGLALKTTAPAQLRLSNWLLPVVLEMHDGKLAIVKKIEHGDTLLVTFTGDQGLISSLSFDELQQHGKQIITLRPIKNAPDARIDDYIRPVEPNWIWRIIFHDIRPYYFVILGSLFVNILGLAGITYSMQTYDRIIPSQSWPTMWVLFSGVILAFILDFILRLLRYSVTDILGKRADLKISDRVFGHSLRIRNGYRPQATGSFIAQLKELEQVREMLTSSTVVAIADLPFFFLFLLIIYSLAGLVFLVPLAGMLLMVLPGLLCQKKLAMLARTAMREANLRNAMLVETIQGLDDIKQLQAEYRFQHQWLHYTATTAQSGLALKHLTHKLLSWSYLVQNGVFVCVVLAGTPLAMSGELSTGALVAASILSSRMMAPVSQLANILTRWQQTKVAISGLDSIMHTPTDYPEQGRRIHKASLSGHYAFKDTLFRHHINSPRPALAIPELNITAGEKIAILGRNGSGKSSLLSALAGQMLCERGTLTLDNIHIDNLDPADLRRDIGYLPQHARLFYGTLRENLTLGAPLASDEEIYQALALSGALGFVNDLPNGIEYQVQEGGLGLSGGQRQSLLLSRLLLRQPDILLLDEPTAALDEETEQHVIDSLHPWIASKTLIIATHRKAVLALVDRIIIVSQGAVVLDQPREQVIDTL
ncbi:type I secretion system permease/ATPase [Entomohabitans teleogrylli]|uniref:type I secretion system permease/ATPase n=1 Tax=Entomohabitans teleogrylli TaxID=1384589 RepID=UPI00073D26E1|nr:type I secretion system permease/ATPase [Entomohabitans teleogrylli]